MNQMSFSNCMQNKNIEILWLIETAVKQLKCIYAFDTLNIAR